MNRNFDIALIVWLVGLSFWVGTAYMRISHNEKTLTEMRETRMRIWDRLTAIDHGLSVIQGQLKRDK